MTRVAVPAARWLLLAGGGFVGVLALVLAGWAPLARVDTALSEAFRGCGGRHPDVVDVLRVATDAMATPSFVGLGLVVAVASALRRDGRSAWRSPWSQWSPGRRDFPTVRPCGG